MVSAAVACYMPSGYRRRHHCWHPPGGSPSRPGSDLCGQVSKYRLGTLLRFAQTSFPAFLRSWIWSVRVRVDRQTQGHYSALAGAIALAILMLPTIIRTSEEMLKLVPGTLREASLALGAAEWKTTANVLLPAAMDGVITGILLSVARAAGETAPLLFTALGNEQFEVGAIIKSGIANHQGFFQVIGRILEQPIDSLR